MSATSFPNSGRTVARVVSVGMEAADNKVLQDCFRQFNIQVVTVDGDAAAGFNREKFEACVVRLYDADAEQVLAAARNSDSNRRIVLYGVARNSMEALRFSKYGVNAIFDEPLDRQRVLKVVRSTYLLVIHELRRYVRVPVVTEIHIEAGLQSITAVTAEVSAGGTSLRCDTPLSKLDTVKVTLSLPGVPKIRLRAFICWASDQEKTYGLRFDPSDENRAKVRDWIDRYLGSGSS
jgi:PilZ domain